MANDRRRVFVIHGRDKRLRDSMFAFLRALGLSPIEWSQAIAATGSASPFIGEVLEAAFSEAQAAVVLLSGDDMAYLRENLRKKDDPTYEKQPTPQTRPNVLFEAGMAFGRHPSETILVQIGAIRPFSDIAGRHVIRLSNAPEHRHEMANRLRIAGCEIDLSGQDWYTTGNFDAKELELSQDPNPQRVQPESGRRELADLNPETILLLRTIGTSHLPTVSELRNFTGLNQVRVEHYVDQLMDMQLIRYSGDSKFLILTKEARAFLVNNGYV